MNSYRHSVLFAIAFAIAGLVVTGEGAQAQDVTATHRRDRDEKECRKAAKDLEKLDRKEDRNRGQGRRDDERDLLMATLLQCGTIGGQAAAETIRDARGIQDPEELEQTVGAYRNFRDASVLSASLDVANDRSASIPARIFALRTLWMIRTGQYWFGYDQLVPSSESTPAAPHARCGQGIKVSHQTPLWYDGAPMPADFETRILALADGLIADTTQPIEVRAAATCTVQR